MLNMLKLFRFNGKQKIASCFMGNGRKYTGKNNSLSVSEEVKYGLNNCLPVVALESTIITHGMPYPRNVECALAVEDAVRSKGAIPATIAIMDGKVKVGLSQIDIVQLGDPTSKPHTLKTSRRDMAYVISNKLSGGTTVSGTLLICHQAGIPIFATGGIGGVHRFGEQTLDVSADLTELGKSAVAVFSSGAKSILDIPKTLEYLETQGVFVATYGDTKEFPAFYCRDSGHFVPYNINNPVDAAKIILANHDFNLGSGMLFGVPVPKEDALDSTEMTKVIEDALKLAAKENIAGKDVTPFLLAKVAEATSGRSLLTNIALVKNNARVAAMVAVELSKLRGNRKSTDSAGVGRGGNDASATAAGAVEKRPVIIGGSVLDRCATVLDDEIKLDGRIHDGRFTESPGGVARNIAEAMNKLGSQPNFLSTIGEDSAGSILRTHFSPQTSKYVRTIRGASTAQCAVIFDNNGECKFLIGDMDIHKEISPKMIQESEDVIKNASILVIDGNPKVETIGVALEIAQKYNIPVFFEPTDLVISEKPFKTKFWEAIKFITPNINELKHIAKTLGVKLPNCNSKNKIEEAAEISKLVSKFIDNVIVTLGSEGLIIARYADASKPLLLNEKETNLQIRHYEASLVENLINVSGAGDCLAAGLISAMLKGLPEENCMSVAFQSARFSLGSQSAVPGKLFGMDDPSWKTAMKFKKLL